MKKVLSTLAISVCFTMGAYAENLHTTQIDVINNSHKTNTLVKDYFYNATVSGGYKNNMAAGDCRHYVLKQNNASNEYFTMLTTRYGHAYAGCYFSVTTDASGYIKRFYGLPVDVRHKVFCIATELSSNHIEFKIED